MSKEFLYTLLDSMSVSGHEIPLQKKVIAEMTPTVTRSSPIIPATSSAC